MSKFAPLRRFARRAAIPFSALVVGFASAQITGNELDGLQTIVNSFIAVGVTLTVAWLSLKAMKKYGNRAV